MANATRTTPVVHTKWKDVREDQMRMGITRKFVHSNDAMVAQITLPKGSIVPAHRHDNEQYTYVLTGALAFTFYDEQDEEIVVRAGEIVLIPSGVLHSAVAVEDCFELDIFTPPRADWIDGSDAYLRK